MRSCLTIARTSSRASESPDRCGAAGSGGRIAFKGKLPAKGSELGAVELNSMGSKKFAFVQLVDAELLTRPDSAR